MAKYLIQVSYTAEAWKAQIAARQSVLERATPSATKLGGEILGLYYSLGEYDLVGIVEFPSAEAAAAWSTLITSGGAVTRFVTTGLLTVDEGLSALALAADAGGTYVSPVQPEAGSPR
jgi:uncharacterized protein with GYD domain